jgi:LPXTG-motif cell wall-anchored protein
VVTGCSSSDTIIIIIGVAYAAIGGAGLLLVMETMRMTIRRWCC